MRVTLYGFLQYDPTLFEGLLLPEGLDAESLVDEIMERSGDLFPYYQQPERLKRNISHWSEMHYDAWRRMLAALTAEYNPIENYDRYETTTETPNLTNTTQAHSESMGTAGTEQKTSAENADDYQPEGRSDTTTGDSSTSGSTMTQTGTRSYSAHMHGNIGTTRNQEMVSDEISLRKSYNLYEMIAAEFEAKFLTQVY